MVSEAGGKKSQSAGSILGLEFFLLIAFLLMAFIAVFSSYNYNILVGNYSDLEGRYSSNAFNREAYDGKVAELDQLNQQFALVLQNVDNALEDNDIEAARSSLYIFDEKVDGIPIKVFANVKDNISKIVEDVKNLPYKKNIRSIKIKNMEVSDVMTIEGNETEFGVGGIYIPDTKSIEMYFYFTEGLVHEDCHHIQHDKIKWEDHDSWIYLNRESNSSDFVSYYSKRNEKEDFAETCTAVFLNESIANTTVLNKKANIVKKYV